MENTAPLVAGTYQIIGQIGSGGGGIVYLGEHTRLGKKVVLKADKRTLSAKPEVLRRDVDALKNLSHTYIPQVYDFIEENGTVYTVMDYIDGESFDKPLQRGERFRQAQIIEWACQLLDALIYLHGRPPHGILHADIKPSNVMRTPQGDIRLIDFNIALALGEEGAIAVGRSFGYASPEHYGQEDPSGHGTRGAGADRSAYISTDPVSDVETVVESEPPASAGSRTSSPKTILLNVRSDIYSLGATLYHMMTGERPARNAADVEAISEKDFSPAVVAIISKAMDPNQDLRYQSAEEMRYAFMHLRENDPRMRRYKRVRLLTAASLALLLAIGVFTSFTGLKRMEMTSSALAFAEYAQNALADGDPVLAIDYALQALPQKEGIWTPPYTAQAQKALADSLGVYDVSDGYKPHRVVELPSEPFKIALSPDGKTGAAVYAFSVAVIDTESGETIATLPTVRSALADVVFIDGHTLAYAGESGVSVYDTAAKTVVWTGKPATKIAVSADGRTLAGVYRDDGFATVYSIDGTEKTKVDFAGKKQAVIENDTFADPNDDLLALNRDGTWLAVSFADGALTVYDPFDAGHSVELLDDTSGYTHFEGGFTAEFFAFAGAKPDGASTFAVINMDELVQEGGFDATKRFGVIANEDGIFLSNSDVVVKVHPTTGVQTEIAYTGADVRTFSQSAHGAAVVTTANDCVFFDTKARALTEYDGGYTSCDFVRAAGDHAMVAGRDTPKIRIWKRKTYEQAEMFRYDEYTHDEARIRADGARVMLFDYTGFRLYDRNGALLCEGAIPDAESVYDQQYGKKSGNLAVIYKNALRIYSGETGEMLLEKTGLQSAFYAPYGISVLERDGVLRLIDMDSVEVILSETARGGFAAYCGVTVDDTVLNGGTLIGAAKTGDEYSFAIKDGAVCAVYDGDGAKKFEVPALEQAEAFFTNDVMIVSPLHGTPVAYDLKTGAKKTELEKDSYLTYVKEADGYILTEYITADDKQYAILLDPATCQPLARLPQLADITSSDELVFDYKTGTLRKTRMYSIEELIGLAKGGVL
jgi:serine/threonine protein kinase/WD40 repeat protein